MKELPFPIEKRRPVCLPPKDFGLVANDSMVVSGWGYLEENGEESKHYVLS